MLLRLIIALAIIVSLSGTVHARPVSYPGGWTFMQKSNGSYSSVHAHYSPTASASIGAYIERNWQEDITFTGIQYNRLVKRWNGRKTLENIPFEIKTIEFKSIPIKSQNIFCSIIIRSKSIPPNGGFHIL
mgnify:CR=1 FL=1